MVKPKRILNPIRFAKGTEASRIINEIAGIRGGIDCYLEIGVEYGRTLEAVKARKKIAIDPKFRFNRKIISRKIALFEIQSDKYFKEYTCPKVDVVFLDGFHSGEQTHRDFINLIPYLTESSVVVIDDVMPSDIHSSLESPEIAFRSRNLAGLVNDFKWHGDVFNAIFAIIENFPELKLYTVSDAKNPVTIIFGFDRRTRNFEKLSHYSVSNKNALFLKMSPLLIPDEFSPCSKESIMLDLDQYFKQLKMF
jgi:hypothetical protein